MAPEKAQPAPRLRHTICLPIGEADYRKIQGNTVAEISEAIPCTERTVYRALEHIRSELTAMHEAGND